jgi:hypothetical protein
MDTNSTKVWSAPLRSADLVEVVGSAVSRCLLLPNYIKLAGAIVVWLYLVTILKSNPPRIHGARVHGSKGWWEPSFWLQIRFIFDAQNIISSGYNKVCTRGEL